ncbi:hypothetical protein OS493_039712, partial [Desmophyllum pertusum]
MVQIAVSLDCNSQQSSVESEESQSKKQKRGEKKNHARCIRMRQTLLTLSLERELRPRIFLTFLCLR